MTLASQLETLVPTTLLSSDQVFQIRGQLAAIVPTPSSPEERQRTEREKSTTLMELAASLEPLVSPSLPPSNPSPALAIPPLPLAPRIASASPVLTPATVSPLHSVIPVETGPPALLTTLTGIDPILLAQLQGLAGSGRLNELLSGTPPPPSLPPAMIAPIDDGIDPLGDEFNYDLVSLNIQLTNIDLLV